MPLRAPSKAFTRPCYSPASALFPLLPGRVPPWESLPGSDPPTRRPARLAVLLALAADGPQEAAREVKLLHAVVKVVGHDNPSRPGGQAQLHWGLRV